MDRLDLSNFWIGGAVLHALVLVATGGLFIAGLFLCRRRSDGARNVVRWLKAALFFFGVFTFLFTLYAVLFVVFLRRARIGLAPRDVASSLAYTFQTVARTLVLATLSSLSRGILQAREGKRPKLGLPVAVVTWALTAVNCVLAVAYLGLSLYYRFEGYATRNYASLSMHVIRLTAVPMIFLFVGSVVALGASALVLVKVKNKFPALKTAAITNIAASFLFFVSSIYEVIHIGLYIPLSRDTDLRITPNYTVILQSIFGTGIAFLTLALIFNLTRRKDNGLWTLKAGAPPRRGFSLAPVPQGGFQGQPPMQQGGFQQPGVYYPPPQQQFAPGMAPIQQPVPQQGVAQYPGSQAPSLATVPSPPGQQAQPHATT